MVSNSTETEIANTIVPLFSSPILISKINIDNEDFNNALMYIESIDFNQCFDSDGHKNGFISVNQRLLNEFQMLKIKNSIEQKLKEYLFDYLKLDKNLSIKHQCSWAVKHGYGDKSHIHRHSNSLFSGVLYFKIPHNSGNYLTFYNNQSSFSTSTINLSFEEYNWYNSNEWKFYVEEKTILIFPSHVYHKAPISESYDNRYCISFNYFINGEIKIDTRYINLS